MLLDDDPAQSDRTRDALTASQLYYLQDLTMEAIAQELHTSRSSVSRLLSHARATGLVDIQIRSPLDAPSRLEQEIQARYGVTAHVVPVSDRANDVDRLERVALSVARILGQYFDSNMIMGIAWGSTMSAISRHITPKPTHNSQIVQLNGAGNMSTTGLGYASEILGRFGNAFGAHVQQFPVPAFFDDPLTRQALWRERSMARLIEMQGRMDVALFGLGSPFSEVPSHVYAGGYLDPDDFDALNRDGVVGDVATVFFRADGSTGGIPLNERGTGPDFAVLQRTPRRICVVSGNSKLPSLRGALCADLITDLFLDEGTARALVATP
ncbi:DNA-binding transcriptional regulator LsrR, DeoR family [Cryobacterium psychrotolerans]|uniref:DNA-binding transcriptional regulator LsrR, DeoR family n=1 Tax=Cryobacterium psychrotolerans TaxID=386301 RepID=A0A1G9C6U9_9MICO|nr:MULTISPECIES: sugar-binding domain-containing protein [Cryobacterium]TFD47043.1 sugar-binding transcriptional regulator [Cryobacterium sp. TMT1-2-1]TFD84199.1 sugar-binding transcriptional regulator [Cryobacterium psychrotolerans]SDK47085.1 DNA-binding transcriptional regulator LsrR, DeoR family [Cryobacterium psychrotolerans]